MHQRRVLETAPLIGRSQTSAAREHARVGFIETVWGNFRVVTFASASILALSGCGSSTLPELPKLPLPASAAYAESPAEIYSRIARGAMACWFAPSGPLKRAYVFHADVAPPSDNAGAEIVIHERDTAAPSPRSLRTYRILIARAPEGTFVSTENLKIPEPLASSMKEDVTRWAGGASGCSSTVPEAWMAKAVQPNEMQTGTVPVSTTTRAKAR